jgi:hypothetical protein
MKPSRFALVIMLAGVSAFAGCTAVRPEPPSPAAGIAALAILDRLYFGRNIPHGGEVSDTDWATFLTEVVTPRFPSGFTVLRGDGQWREASGTIVHERSFVLEVNHPDTAVADHAVQEIMADYKRRFAQEAVLRLREHVDASF